MKRGSYGELIAVTPAGKYYWCDVISDINFVPKGKRRSTFREHLTKPRNTRLGALSVAWKRETGGRIVDA